jgi:predicted permease
MFRSLGKSKLLALGVIATLAVGVAALTVSFALLHAALFRQPPFPDAERIVMLYLMRNPPGEPARRDRWSFHRFELLRDGQQSFDAVANVTNPAFTLSEGDQAELVRGELVSPEYFEILGATPERGRLFTAEEDRPGSYSFVVVISHRLWLSRFGGRQGLLGTTVRLNGQQLTVIGVLKEGFYGLSGQADLWVPETMAPEMTYADYLRTNQNFISVTARLKQGVTLEAAQSELGVLGASINREVPSDEENPAERVTAIAAPINEVRADRTVRRSLMVLISGVLLLHLLAGANVINLLLGRASRRKREAAVRLALGSSPGRLFRGFLVQDLALTAVGSLAGVLLAWIVATNLVPPTNAWAGRNFYGSVAPFDAPGFGIVELTFGLALALITALLTAIPSALTAFGVDVHAGIKTGSQGTTGPELSLRLTRPGSRGLLVAIEAALAVLLVLSAGLLIDSFRRMRATQLGVNTSNVLTFWVIPSEAQVLPAMAPAFVTRLLETLDRIPGVVSASVDGGGPLVGTARSMLFIAGRPAPANAAPPILRHYVAPAHFRTLGIPLLRGREFGPGDVAGAPKVTIISESAARKFWPNEDPIGKRVWFGGASAYASPDSTAEIVGIVGDVAYEPLDRQPNKASFYTPYMQFTYASRMVFLRTNLPPLSLLPAVRTALWNVDPDVAIRDPRTLEELVGGSWARTRFEALLFGAFGALALLLAASGTFAVLAYVVANRTREFGIRMALGADTPKVLRLVLREGMTYPLLGIIAGVGVSFLATRALRSSLYEVSPVEPALLAITVALLVLAGLAACVIPALRASRSDPMEAVRAE